MTWKDGLLFAACSAGFAVGSVSVFLTLPSPFRMAAPVAIVAAACAAFAAVQAVQAWRLPPANQAGANR